MEKQHYTGEFCPKCYNNEGEEPKGGVLGHKDGKFKCSNEECSFEAPLINKENMLF